MCPTSFYNRPNKNIVVKIALIIAFVLALISLITHNDISLCKQSSKVHTFSPANAHFFSASFLAGNGLVVS